VTIAEKKSLHTGDKMRPQVRRLVLNVLPAAEGGQRSVDGLDQEARTLTMSFSSEAPVSRWFGNEVLSHAPGAADLSRLNDGANLLWGHDSDDVLGVVEKAWIGDDLRGYVTGRFGRDDRGAWALAQVADGIIRNVSFMYVADDYSADDVDPQGNEENTYTANHWLAYEVSLVSIPADQSVGVGRAAGLPEQTVTVRTTAQELPAPSAASAASTRPPPVAVRPPRLWILSLSSASATPTSSRCAASTTSASMTPRA
jgi:phage head maturation protease